MGPFQEESSLPAPGSKEQEENKDGSYPVNLVVGEGVERRGSEGTTCRGTMVGPGGFWSQTD